MDKVNKEHKTSEITWLKDFILNKSAAEKNKSVEKLIADLRETQGFLNELSYLSFGRGIPYIRYPGIVPINIILDSTSRTLESIIHCCENVNFADAYTLLRKYRDDLFYYLFVLSVVDTVDLAESVEQDKISRAEKHIIEWYGDKQKDLHIGEVLKTIAKASSVKEAASSYNLKESFDKLGNKLNDYVHSNGKSFYNESYIQMEDRISGYCESYISELNYITVTFLFLLTLLNQTSVMSYDYVDSKDCGDKPIEGSEYWVASFVQKFFYKHKGLLDKNCDRYLKEKTGMEF